MSNLLDSASIVLTPTAYDNGRMLSIKPSAALGAELVTNGDFATDSDWALTQATISNGKLLLSTSDGSYTAASQTLGVIGKTYRVSLDVADIVGIISITIGGGTDFDITSNGTHSFEITSTTTTLEVKRKFGVTNVSATIDNVSVKEDISGDFDFSRNSAATRVNAQGLVENVQILSGDLVSNGDFSQEGVQEVSNGSFSQEGAEQVTNGDFATDTDWTKGTGWSISGGSANCDGTQTSTANLNNTLTNNLINGKTYKVVYTISDYVSGSIRIKLGNSGYSSYYSSNGTYVEYVTAVVTTFSRAQFNADADFIGSIDNVSVKEVGQDWSFSSGAFITDIGARLTHTPSAGVINSIGYTPLVIGNNYKMTYEITQSISGGVKLNSAIDTTMVSAVGVHTKYFEADTSYIQISRTDSGANDVTITNISVKEVGQDWTLGTGWSIGDDKAVANNVPNGQRLQTSTTASVVGNKYKYSLNISNISGAYTLYIFGVNALISVSTEGIVEGYVTATSTNGAIYISGATVGGLVSADISNISVIEITDDTNLPRINYEGFSYQDSLGSELLTSGNDTSNIVGLADNQNINIQSSFLTLNKTYKITFEIYDYVEGSIFLLRPNNLGAGTAVSANGTYSYTVLANASTSLIFRTDGLSTTLKLKNISIKEYLGQEVVPDSGCGSWLLEPQSTNLAPYSEDFSQWGNARTNDTANQANSPNGLNNGTLLEQQSGETNAGSIYLTGLSLLSGTYTQSVFAKKKDKDFIVCYSANAERNYFNLANGTIGTIASGNSAKIKDYGNGWYKCSITYTITTGDVIAFYLADTDNSTIVTDSGGIYIWGAMLEQQSYPTSYIPTNGAASTRLQDIANNSGNATLINSTEGVLYAEIEALTSTQAATIMISISNGSTNAIKFGYQQGANVFFVESTGTANGIGIYSEPINPLTYSKVALSYKENDVKLYINGVLEAIDTSFTAFAPDILNTLNFDSGTGASKFYGKTKALVVYKEALTDEQLTCLTTI